MKLNEMINNIDLNISKSLFIKKISLHYATAQKSIAEKMFVHCKCKNERFLCQNHRCACYKVNMKCFIAYHEDKKNLSDYLNISSIKTKTQKNHQQRDLRLIKERSKHQQRK